MGVDEPHDRLRVGSISDAKNALAARNTSLTRRSSAFSFASLRFSSSIDVDGQIVALAVVGLGLADPQRLRVHVQLLGQPPDHRSRLRLAVQPHRTLPQLRRILSRSHSDILLHLPRIKPGSEVSGKTGEAHTLRTRRGTRRSMKLAGAGIATLAVLAASACSSSAAPVSPVANLASGDLSHGADNFYTSD